MAERPVCVVGSGVGGFTTALLLAAHGRRVILVEKNMRTAPLLRRFKRGGVWCDTGFHYVGGLAPGQRFHHLLRALGVADALRFNPMPEDGFDVLRGFPGGPFQVPAGLERVREALLERFPKAARPVDAYLNRIVEAHDATDFAAPRRPVADCVWDARRTASLARVMSEIAAPVRMAEILDFYNYMLAGAHADHTPFHLHATVVGSYLLGAHRLERAGDALADALHARAEALGVEIRTASLARRIVLDAQRRVRSVEIESAEGGVERIACREAVAAVDPQALLEMLQDGALPKDARERLEAMPRTFSPFMLFLDLAEPPEGLLQTNQYVLLPGGPNKPSRPIAFLGGVVEGEARAAITAVSPIWESDAPGDAPEWRDSVCPRRQPRPAVFAEPHGEQYREFKERLIGETLAAAEQTFPEIGASARVLAAATPCTLERVTGVRYGAAYGVRQSPGGPPLGATGPAAGLLLAGQNAQAPGVLGAVLSGFAAAGEILGMETVRRLAAEAS